MSQYMVTKYELEELAAPLLALLDEYRDHWIAWLKTHAITFPIFHRTAVEIESPDPISGEMIQLTSTPDGVRNVNPTNAVVSWVRGTASPENVRAWFCNDTNFFTSTETASQYVANHPELVIVPIDQVFRIGQLMWEREPYQSLFDELALRNES